MISEEVAALAYRLAREEVAPDLSPEFQALDVSQRSEALGLACYIIRRDRAIQRRARRFFRSWLSAAQLGALRRRGAIVIRGSAGGRYRIDPEAGRAERVERHGRRWFARASYCLHPSDEVWPDADVALAHLLLILTDEPAFLAAANKHPRTMLWNGAWLRRLHAARRERTTHASAAERAA